MTLENKCECPCECGKNNSTSKYCNECDPFHTTYQRSELKKHLGKHFRGKRKEFPNSMCRVVLLKQKGLCNICKKFYKTWDFDHIDEDPSNNAQSNCQALCRNCHGEKSRKNRTSN